MFKRHNEYRDVFNLLYKSLEKQYVDYIVFAGDFVHEKSHVSPELFDMTVDHINNLASLCSTNLIIIPGNHDGVLSNLSRMDTLSPIIKAINNDKIKYYKNSGVYKLGSELHDDQASFSVFSCFDDESKWPTIKDINPNELNIGIFHGMVQGAVLQNGQIVEDCPYRLKQFLDIVDFLLLGDIHAEQILDMNYRAAYCGSYPQQSYAESVDKGYLLWDIQSKKKHKIDFIKLQSLYPFYTIELNDKLELQQDTSLIKDKCRIRIISRALTNGEKSSLQDKINLYYNPLEILFHDKDKNSSVDISLDSENKLKVDSLDSIQTQEKLIKDFFASHNLTEEIHNKIFSLNKLYDIKFDESFLRNVQYKIEKMSFYNMFSYGEDNEFDFSKYKGIVGIFGKNGSGKSSLIVDIPLYIMKNRISKKRVVKNDDMINENKEACGGELQISIGNTKYFMRRATHVYVKTGKGAGAPVSQGKTDLDFKIIHPDGTEEDKNAEERSQTDKEITKIFGSVEDMMATFIAAQWELLGIVDAGGTERQKIIAKYFDINIFEEKFNLAKDEFKSLKSKLSIFDINKIDEDIKKNETELNDYITKNQLNEIENKKLDELKKQLSEKIKTIETNKLKFNDKINILNKERTHVLEKLSLYDNKIKNIQKYSCLKNSDCCLLIDLAANEEHYKILERDLAVVEQKIHLNNTNKELFEKENIQSEDEKNFKKLENDLQKNADNTISYLTNIARAKTKIENLLKDEKQYLKLQEEYQIYDYYLLAMGKDGIPKNITSRNLNVINAQIKKFLSGNVNFDIYLSSVEDGKSIEIFFKHEKNKPRKIELCSGAEKTLTAIVIRAALLSITTLPRANIFVLDEVSFLDAEYLDAFGKILEQLKTMFDTVYIITHLDVLKDMVDHSIEVVRDDQGYSIIKE
jgi:predicted phosphodiesterase